MNKLLLPCVLCFVCYSSSQRGSDRPMTTAGFFGGDMAGFNPNNRNAITNRKRLWPNGIIPYVIDREIGTLTPLINSAVKQYANKTCIKFVQRSKETDYIYFTKNSGCWSNVGRFGGRQIVSLDRGCGYIGTILHEMMHVTGFWHEQNRPDRDGFVTIVYNNILQGQEFNFIKFKVKEVDLLGVEYDYKSVMHYGEYSFSRNTNKPTIIPKQDGVRIGDVWEKKELSESDVNRINKLYNC